MYKDRISSKLAYLLIFSSLVYCSYIVTSSIYSFLISISIVTSYIFLSNLLSNKNITKEAKEYLGLQVVLTLIYWLAIGKTFVDDMNFNGIIFFIIIMIFPYFSKLSYERKHQ